MRQEKELTLEKLLWDVILGWRKWLVCGLVFAILLVGYKFVADYQYINGQQAGESSLTEKEKAEVERARKLQGRLLFLEEYAEKSIRLKVDYYNVLTYRLRFYIDSDYKIDFNGVNETDYTDSLVVAYNEYARVGELTQDVLKETKLDIAPKYLQELVSVTATEHVVEIKIIHYDSQTLEQISEAVKIALAKQKDKLAKEVGAHTIVTVSESIFTELDQNLLTEQETHITNMENLQKKYDSFVAQLSSVQQGVLSQEQEDSENVVSSESTSINVKYLVVGFALGVVLAVFWILVKTIFSSKLQRTEELADLYKMRNIANLDLIEENSKLGKRIDAWLLRIKNKKINTVEQQIEILCANIEVVCKGQNINKVYFTGTELDKLNSKVLEKIVEKLKVLDIQVILGADICANIKSLKEMVEVGSVVIVEQVNVSFYDEIEKEVRIAKDNNVNIVGCIGVEE